MQNLAHTLSHMLKSIFMAQEIHEAIFHSSAFHAVSFSNPEVL